MKKMNLFVFISVLMSLLSCSKERISGNGSTISEVRNINNFAAVSVSGSTNVYITQGVAFAVEVKGYSNLLPYFETKIINNTLTVGYKQNVNVKNDNTEVFIIMPVLHGLGLYGSANINTTGSFNNNTNFIVKIAGSGNIKFSNGTTTNFYSDITGSGNVYAINMIANNAETTISGSGNTEITANNQLKVKITGSGNVYYKGTPLIFTSISGSGAVIPK